MPTDRTRSVVFALNIFAQKVDYKTNSYTYTIGKSKYLVINLNVVNSSDYKIPQFGISS